mgnify:CR=1 FL=1
MNFLTNIATFTLKSINDTSIYILRRECSIIPFRSKFRKVDNSVINVTQNEINDKTTPAVSFSLNFGKKVKKIGTTAAKYKNTLIAFVSKYKRLDA